jgi:hypothetical protein
MARTIARSRFQRAVARGARGDGCPNLPPGGFGRSLGRERKVPSIAKDIVQPGCKKSR